MEETNDNTQTSKMSTHHRIE